VSTIRLAATGDIARLAFTATRAFADDPLMRWFFPEPVEYEEVNPQVTGYLCRRWMATESLWCTDDGVGMAGWVPPGRPDVDVERPAIEHPEHRLAKFAAVSQMLVANTPPEPHWYLNMLATHPDWQRQGIGTAMMNVVFTIADEMGVACYLETESTDNVAYYRHHDFEVRTEWDLRTDAEPGPHMWGMLRPAMTVRRA
jgi:ribosomal protein S18 acetylase RimI-like enzyme